MAWFHRKKAGILTKRDDQNEVPEGQWVKCPKTGEIVNRREVEDNLYVFPGSGYHFGMSSHRYFDLLFDDDTYTRHDTDLYSTDVLDFEDRKPYTQRLEKAQKKTGQNEAVQSATGPVGGYTTSIAAMDFSFIGGSMGSVVGEIIARAIKRAYTNGYPLITITQSGGARMMEGALSLMQMAKTSAHLTRLEEAGLPFISILTHPTTGGVTASFAMLGDFHIAEPEALIGFAGPRVIRETIGSDLPEGFQRSEFLLEHGFIDMVVDRRQLQRRVIALLDLIMEDKQAA